MADTLFSVLTGIFKRMRDMGDGSHAEVVVAQEVNPAVVGPTQLTTVAAAGSPTLVSQLDATNSVSIAGGTVDAVTARITAITGGAGTATVSFFGTDDGVNLFALSGLPIGGAIGSGSFANSGAAVGAWSLKGASARTVYAVVTALGATSVSVGLAATPNQSRVTSVMRGSLGGSVSAAAGSAPSEAVAVQGISGGTALPIIGSATTVTTSFNRPADAFPFTANDSISDSTSAPTTGGFTLTNAARTSGGSGIIVGMVIVSSNDPATTLQGEIWLYDSAVTADNDNAAFTSSDSDTLKLVGIVPFTLASTQGGSGTTSVAPVTGLNIPFTCVGSANLRFKVKAKNAYTPASGETISVRAQIVHTS